MAKERRGRGRPPKAETATTNTVYVRLTDDVRAGLKKFKDRGQHTTDSDAVRAMMVRVLREDGLLPEVK